MLYQFLARQFSHRSLRTVWCISRKKKNTFYMGGGVGVECRSCNKVLHHYLWIANDKPCNMCSTAVVVKSSLVNCLIYKK